MTVIANNARNQYVAVASQTIFTYSFEILDQDNLKVYLTPEGQTPNDVTDLLTITQDYTVTGVGVTTGGTIVLTTGASAGDIVTIQGNTPNSRDTSFTPGGVIQAQNLNTEFDNLVLITQTTDAVLNKIVPKYQEADVVATKDIELPLLGPGEAWVMNNGGTAIEAMTVATEDPGGPFLPLAGGTMTGSLILDGPATLALEPVTLSQLNGITQGYITCDYATTGNLAGYTYANGSSGVGATLTAGGFGAFTVDGETPVVNSSILVASQTNAAQNGKYVLSTAGDGSTAAILTRATDFDTSAEMIPGLIFRVLLGDTLQASQWLFTTIVPVTVGTTDLDFVEYSNQDALLRSNNLSDVDSASTSRTNLGAQTVNANLTSISALGTAADKTLYTTGVNTWAETGITAFGRTLINEADAAAAAALIGSGVSIAIRAITTTSTYTPTTGMKYCRVLCIGGGGGGGGVTSGDGAGGGGAGGFCERDFSAADIGASQSVTIGAAGAGGANGNGSAGGNTLFGSFMTANGGAGGITSSNNTNLGGAGGTASGGTININGANGNTGYIFYTDNPAHYVTAGGNGAGCGLYGGGGIGSMNVQGSASVGTNATGYGSGGGGAGSVAAAPGYNGSSGIVIIYEYI